MAVILEMNYEEGTGKKGTCFSPIGTYLLFIGTFFLAVGTFFLPVSIHKAVVK
jgi:hypothetical protein